MKTIPLLYTLLVLGICHCGSSDEGESTPSYGILDIANPNLDDVSVHCDNTGFAIYRSYFPKNRPFKKVVDNGVKVWRCTPLERCTAVLSTFENDVTKLSIRTRYSYFKYRFIYLEKREGVWRLLRKTRPRLIARGPCDEYDSEVFEPEPPKSVTTQEDLGDQYDELSED